MQVEVTLAESVRHYRTFHVDTNKLPTKVAALLESQLNDHIEGDVDGFTVDEVEATWDAISSACDGSEVDEQIEAADQRDVVLMVGAEVAA